MITYKFYSDPGHGWLEVSMSTLDNFGIADRISPYSFTANGYAYLEEDCDAGTFLGHLAKLGVPFTIKDVDLRSSDNFIRSSRRFPASDNWRERLLT